MKIFVDLDGVLADFTAAALEIHGKSEDNYTAALKKHPDTHPFDLIEDVCGCETAQDFWAPINAGDFFANLQELPWAKSMLHMLMSGVGVDNVCILTSPPRVVDGTAASDKLKWVKNHFGEPVARKTILCPSPAKHALSDPSRVLIDDLDLTVDRWHKMGGYGIRFPSLQFDGRHPEIETVEGIIEEAINYVKGVA